MYTQKSQLFLFMLLEISNQTDSCNQAFWLSQVMLLHATHMHRGKLPLVVWVLRRMSQEWMSAYVALKFTARCRHTSHML